MRIKPDFWDGPNRICWLCVLMKEFVGINSLENAPIVMSGMTSIINAPSMKLAKQAIFNMRQISTAYTTNTSVKHAVALYNEHHYNSKTQGTYEINADTLHFRRVDPLEDPLIQKARQILQSSMTYQCYGIKVADPKQDMAVSLGEQVNAVRIPIGPIVKPLKARITHTLRHKPKEAIRIPISELQVLAVEMDEREKSFPERRLGNWAARLKRFALMVPDTNNGLKEERTIELDGIKQLIGLPGSGKTTLLVLIAVWLGKHGYRAMFVFPSIEVSRQYMNTLRFHRINAGLLVGQSKETRRRHADNIAEAIAAGSNNGGFAHTLEGAESFSLNCVLPAFSNANTNHWRFGHAPCQDILQNIDDKNRMKRHLCPVWTMCGRQKATRNLISSNIWVGHIRSMDTQISSHAIQEKIRYFEFISRTFDVVVFDEADMVQSSLDDYGVATLSISGSERSVHRIIQEQIHNPFARGENHRLSDRDVELYSRDLAEFGNHNTSFITAVQNLSCQRVSDRYEGQLLTVLRIVSDLLNKAKKVGKNSGPQRENEKDLTQGFKKSQVMTDFWENAAYTAFYNRTVIGQEKWNNAKRCSQILDIKQNKVENQWERLTQLFRQYLAENQIQKRDNLIEEIAKLFLNLCFPKQSLTAEGIDTIILLISVTFVILGYRRIIPGTRTMVSEGLIKDPIVESTASPELRRMIPESILGSFSGVKFTCSKALTTQTTARNVELSYIAFVGAPRLLMHRFNQLLSADNNQPGPAVLMTSATSFLEASPAYHVNVRPSYLLKTRQVDTHSNQSIYRFKWFPDHERGDEPLRYSGAGELRDRNLKRMVEALVQGGQYSEVYKSINDFNLKHDIPRKAAFVVNGYEQCRMLKKFLNNYHPIVGRHTKAVVRSLREGETSADFVTPAQCEALGDDENCHIIIFPMLAIGRGVNIVFTKGDRKLDAAIGSIYFLTRPHPTMDDMQLLYSLAGKATQDFDNREFDDTSDLNAITSAWQQARKDLWRQTGKLLREPLMASRLGPELFKYFTANQMVAILQTIGRGMRNGCPVEVCFVDAAWALQSTKDKPDSGRDSMLVQMRLILEECMQHSDPISQTFYQELYREFLEPLQQVHGVIYPKELRSSDYCTEDDDYEFDDSPLLEL